MEIETAVVRFAALAQVTRLEAVRILVKAGPTGMPAGALVEAMGVAASTLSFHLKELQAASLIVGQRNGRQIIYRANFDAVQGLVQFLLEDCCGNDPAACPPGALNPAKISCP